MTFKDFYKREKHIILRGQSRRFRVIKYIIIFSIAFGIYVWKDLTTVGFLLIFFSIIAIIVHFFFRWKTKAWTKSWGPYKQITLNNE